MTAKGHPDKVEPSLARAAIQDAKEQRTTIWTHYILRHYRTTGNLAPGCDARDLFAWLDATPDVPEWCKAKVRR